MLTKYSAQRHSTGLLFQQIKSETLESSAANNEWAMLAIFLTVLYMEEGLETEMLKYDLMQ